MRLLRVNEMAKELGCSESFLRRAEKTGKIPKARRDLNRWRVYTEDDLQRLRELLIPQAAEDSADNADYTKKI